MPDVPISVAVAAFPNEEAAGEQLRQLKELKKEKMIGIIDAAVIRKDDEGEIHIKETAEMSTGKGVGIGAVLGGAIGLLAGPVGLLAGGGAIVGWLASRRDRGFKNERLERIGEGLTPGSSAIIAVVEHKWVAEVERELANAGADVMTEVLAEEIAAELEKEKEFSVGGTA